MNQGPSFLTNLGCFGSESSLLDCRPQFVTDERCSSNTRAVGVKCVGEMLPSPDRCFNLQTISFLQRNISKHKKKLWIKKVHQ